MLHCCCNAVRYSINDEIINADSYAIIWSFHTISFWSFYISSYSGTVSRFPGLPFQECLPAGNRNSFFGFRTWSLFMFDCLPFYCSTVSGFFLYIDHLIVGYIQSTSPPPPLSYAIIITIDSGVFRSSLLPAAGFLSFFAHFLNLCNYVTLSAFLYKFAFFWKKLLHSGTISCYLEIASSSTTTKASVLYKKLGHVTPSGPGSMSRPASQTGQRNMPGPVNCRK